MERRNPTGIPEEIEDWLNDEYESRNGGEYMKKGATDMYNHLAPRLEAMRKYLEYVCDSMPYQSGLFTKAKAILEQYPSTIKDK